MHDLNALYYFAQVVKHGGFAAAGRALGLPKSTLSRRIAELEQRLGVRLLQRSTRRLALTEVGERYLRHCQALVEEAEAAEQAVANLRAEPSGRLRIACPGSLARQELSQRLPAFLARYPKLQLEFVLTGRRVDLIEEGIDVALRVRIAGQEDPHLATRRLRPMQAYLVASPALFAERSMPDRPEELAQLPLLGAVGPDRRMSLALLDPTGKLCEYHFEVRLAVDDFHLRKPAALAGLGITFLPEYYCADELAAGTLIKVLPDWSLPPTILHVVYPTQRGLSPAVRALVDFLAEHLAAEPSQPDD
ncbi:LysR substrate-binding domain-containing protein [Chitinimonas lacunae]|uniref:LysR substrate-binding domain-containing protein n=1 Tax=Chitinimonas lacunae TaxID=1963018 RepID=A0ABV8MLW8_9NEIS